MTTSDGYIVHTVILHLFPTEPQEQFPSFCNTLESGRRVVINKHLIYDGYQSSVKSNYEQLTMTSAPLSHISLTRVLRDNGVGRDEIMNADSAIEVLPSKRATQFSS